MVGRAYNRMAVDRDVKCQIDGADTWVRLYDLSGGGAMFETGGLDIAIGDTIELSLSELVSIQGTIVWKIEKNAGVRFDGVLADWILERLGVEPTSRDFEDALPRDRFGQALAADVDPPEVPTPTAVLEPRERRLETDIPARLGPAGGETIDGRLTNLSSHGCKFAERSGRFRTGDTIELLVGSMEPWPGTVRWAIAGELGIEFSRVLHQAVVDHLLAINDRTG